jgi:hypothetical protein
MRPVMGGTRQLSTIMNQIRLHRMMARSDEAMIIPRPRKGSH